MAEFFISQANYDNSAIITWLKEQECSHYALLLESIWLTESTVHGFNSYSLRSGVVVGIYDPTIAIMFKLRFDAKERAAPLNN
jgi:hypothetical protein